MNRAPAFVLSLVLVACGGGADPDAGPADDDAGPAVDDAGASMDAGPDDGGADSDAGEADAGPLAPVVCDDAIDDVYAVDPASVAGVAPGDIVACAMDTALSQAEIDTLVDAPGVTITSGAQRVLIAYRTERQPGVAGVGSAWLLLPDTPSTDPSAPVVVVNHGTAGHADSCAPTTRMNPDPQLALPWVGAGLVTVVVDYAGLGTLGIQGYGDAFDTAQSVLDGARAGLRYLREDRPIVMTGHSQGGAATLSAQGLARTYAPELNVVRAISFAGGTASGLELTPAQAPLLGLIPITGGLGVNRAIFAMLVYADFANRFGVMRAGEGFHPSIRATVVDSMENDCIFQMALRLARPAPGYVPPNNFGQLVDPAFLTGVQGCVAGTAGCTAEGMAFVEQRTMRGFIPVDPMGADILLISGSDDALHAPDEFACVLDAAQTAGATVDACYLMGSDHGTVPGDGAAAALEFGISGTVSCPASAAPPPACP